MFFFRECFLFFSGTWHEFVRPNYSYEFARPNSSYEFARSNHTYERARGAPRTDIGATQTSLKAFQF